MKEKNKYTVKLRRSGGLVLLSLLVMTSITLAEVTIQANTIIKTDHYRQTNFLYNAILPSPMSYDPALIDNLGATFTFDYLVSHSLNNGNFEEISTTVFSSYIDTGVVNAVRYNYFVTASDRWFNKSTQSEQVSVLAGNEPPAWKPMADLKDATVDVSYSEWLRWRVTDPEGNSLTFKKVSGPDWLEVNTSNGNLTGTPKYTDFDINNFVFSVSDGFNPPVEMPINLIVLPKTIRFLIIGNSFASNAIKYIDDIVAADIKTKLIIEKAIFERASLKQHWDAVIAHEADQSDLFGKPYGGKSLRELLISNTWDVVTIQQFSLESVEVTTYSPFAMNLYDTIKFYAPQADIRFHQTWAYRSDDKQYTAEYTQADMHRIIRSNYHEIARQKKMKIIPVGDAFANAREHLNWNFVHDASFDYEKPDYPNLPLETDSLNVGFKWKPDQKTFKIDTHHANEAGKYLAGAVFFEALFEKSIINNSFVFPEEVSIADVMFLQQIAHDTVANMGNTNPSFNQ